MSSNLAISLVIGASVGAAISGINQIKSTIKALGDSSISTSLKIDNLNKLTVSGMKSSIASITALGGSVVALAKPAIEFESAMADVKKVVDFKTPEGFKKLSNELLDLTDTIPMTAKELAAIAASGGQLGVAEEDIKSFTTTIAKMSVAFDMSADASGDAMAKLANVYKIPINEIGKLGDAINDLSNSSPAKASDIVNTLGRVGGTAKQFGLTENAAASLSSTFISLGKTPEVAGTAINGMLTQLMTAEKGGKAFQRSLAMMGLSAKKLKANIAKDGEGAITDFLKRINKLPKDKVMSVLVDIFGKEYADDVAVLAGNTELLEKSLKQLKETDENGNLRYLGSMDKEFQARAATTENALVTLKNSVTKLGITVGNYLLPIITRFVNWLQPIILGISDWINQNGELMETIAQIGSIVLVALTSFSAMVGVMSGLTFIGLKIFSIFKLIWTILSFGGNVISIVAGLITKLFLPLILKLAYGFGQLLGWGIKFATLLGGALFKGLMMAGRAILFLSRAFLTNPIGLAITAIAVGAYFIWDNWAKIAPLFQELWQSITGYFDAAWTWIQSAWSGAGDWVARIWGGVTDFFSGLWSEVTTAFDGGIVGIGALILNWSPIGLFHKAFAAVLSWFGIDIPSNFSTFATNALNSFTQWITQWDILGTFKTVFDNVFAWFSQLPSRFMEFGGNIVSGLKDGISGFATRAKDNVIDFASNISNGFKSRLGIQSPSRVFKGYGLNIVEGVALGIGNNTQIATKRSKQLGEHLALAMPTQLDAPHLESTESGLSDYQPLVRSPSTTGTTSGQITVHFNPTLNLSGNHQDPSLVQQIQQALLNNSYEFEQLLKRVLDQQQRVAY